MAPFSILLSRPKPKVAELPCSLASDLELLECVLKIIKDRNKTPGMYQAFLSIYLNAPSFLSIIARR